MAVFPQTLYGEQQPVPASPDLRERDQRLESLKVLAGRLAHDFNNSLAPLLGYLALIKEETHPDSPVLQYALAMESSARRTEAILEEVLLATRPLRQFRPEWLDIAGMIQKETEQWQQALPPGAPIDLDLKLEPCRILGDRHQWQLVWRHLLKNAGWALARGGRLEVSLAEGRLVAERMSDLGLAVPAVYQVALRDTGAGMTEETRRRVFEPFFSTRPKTEAAGLGLALVHSVVRCHGGQIEIESEPGAGTTVTLWIPVSIAEPARPSPSEAPRAGGTVLIVDDDPVILEVTSEFLKQAHFNVRVALNGRDGIAQFQSHARAVSLVISDLTMPQMDGIQMVREIRRLAPEMPVILISGTEDEVRERAVAELAAERVTLLRKPFLMKELLRLVEDNLY